MKYLLVILFVIIFTIIVNGLAALWNVPTYEVYGPFIVGVISVLIAEDITKEGR